MPENLDHAIASVVRTGNCAGCGACCLLDSGLEMQLNEHGYSRPVRVRPGSLTVTAAGFDRICPGRVVSAQKPEGSTRHRLLGSSFASWQAWALKPEIRHRASSGGAITALVSWLLDDGRVTEVVESSIDPEDPRRTVTVSVRTPDEALAAAGSRYAPVSNAAHAVLGRPDVAFVGKPCEVAAVRALARETGEVTPLLISFFCAGTPSQASTEALVDRLAAGSPVRDLWYRGRGWPGSFTVVRADGGTAVESYDQSWGHELGPTVQWRCKICPDGVGESADIVAADFWDSDERGRPTFEERPGVSALIARTRRGQALVAEAFSEGALAGSALDLDDLARVQPSQVERRRTLLARALGARLARRPVPRLRGFAFWRVTRGRPRQLASVARGSYRRIRSGRADG